MRSPRPFLPAVTRLHQAAPSSAPSSVPASQSAASGSAASSLVERPAAEPLVSCVMVTRGRAAFVRQSIAYFEQQDYANRELVIVYEAESDLPSPLPASPRLRTKRVVAGLSIGNKRNVGVVEAQGEIIAQWDDDDWYAPARLRCQVAPLLADTADITGLRALRYFELPTWKLWTCSLALHARMFLEDVAGGTLVYRRALWGKPARYPATSLREDADFLQAAMRAGARLERLEADDLFIYVRHGANTWRFVAGEMLMPEGWRELGAPQWSPELERFYRAQAARHRQEQPTQPARPGARALRPAMSSTRPPSPSPSPAAPPPLSSSRAPSSSASPVASPLPISAEASPASPPRALPPPPPHSAARRAAARAFGDLPSVACIMPTFDRPELANRAVRHFLRQSYPNRQLIVVDDGVRPLAPHLPADERIRYLRLERRMPLGAKRNYACANTAAEIIVHWDDDDWMAPGWIDAQVHALTTTGADATGLSQVYFYAPVERRAWRYVYPTHGKPWVHGATLCYTRSFWARNPFPPVTVGEDLRFLWNGSSQRIVPHEQSELFVAYVHAGNTSPKRFISSRWQALAVEHVDRLMVRHGEPDPSPPPPPGARGP